MKTTIFKKIMIPLIFIFVGISGAFVTAAMSHANTATLSTVQGYRFVSQADPCHAELMCSDVVTPIICTSGGQQLWGKVNPNVNVCDVPLYKIPN